MTPPTAPFLRIRPPLRPGTCHLYPLHNSGVSSRPSEPLPTHALDSPLPGVAPSRRCFRTYPFPTPNATLFGTLAFLNSHLNTNLAATTESFLTVGRAVRLLHGHKPLHQILQDHAAPIEAYVTSLAALSRTHADLLEQLMTRNDTAASITDPHDTNPFHHTLTPIASMSGIAPTLSQDSDRYKFVNFIAVAVCNSIPHETHRGPVRLRPSLPWSR